MFLGHPKKKILKNIDILYIDIRIEFHRDIGVDNGKTTMRCPFCKEDSDRVVDSRSSDSGRTIRRRRQCLACKRRFTTYERVGESFKLSVIKKDDSRVPYDRERIVIGLQKACYKRRVSAEQIQQIADRVEEDIFRQFDKEVPSTFIGESIIKYLREVDKVAYIRFASVYREFKDADELFDELSESIKNTKDARHPRLFDTD
jgi:transcriptional repressor NrdR